MNSSSVLILPGLYNSGPQHWQTRWEVLNPAFKRIHQDDWDKPLCADWVARLNDAIAANPDAVLVGHSSACAMVAHWVAGGGRGRVRGALLVGPSDPEAPSYPSGPTGFAPMPLVRLPFKSIVVTSANDPYVSIARARRFASVWGSRLVDIGNAGHINGESGLGDWPSGLELLKELQAL